MALCACSQGRTVHGGEEVQVASAMVPTAGASATTQTAVASAMPTQQVTATDSVRHDTLTFAMVGDIMPGTTYPSPRLPKEGGRLLFRHCDSLLHAADVAMGNLEGVMCEGGTSTNIGNPTGYSFRIPPSYAGIFPEAGFDYLNLANNHLRDFGPYGYELTQHILDSIQMPYSGIKGGKRYSIIERRGVRIGICSFGQNEYCYQHTVDSAIYNGILRELRAACDLMVVSIHGGAEGVKAAHLPYDQEYYVGEKRGKLREFAHHCIDMGADLIHGHGPHVPRAVELYKGRFIAYSLGNFCTPFGLNIKGMCGHAPLITVRLTDDGRFVDGQIHSFVQVYGDGPKLDPLNAAAKDIRQLTAEDIRDSQLRFEETGASSFFTIHPHLLPVHDIDARGE